MVISVCKPEGLTSAERKGSYFLCGKVIKGKGERESVREEQQRKRERERERLLQCSVHPSKLNSSLHMMFIVHFLSIHCTLNC